MISDAENKLHMIHSYVCPYVLAVLEQYMKYGGDSRTLQYAAPCDFDRGSRQVVSQGKELEANGPVVCECDVRAKIISISDEKARER